ncbi:MAG: LON peptidase substrate-binding domain-containing protein [Ilumatobacteraceae bacterium]
MPMFPLGSVLLPGGVLPLHVFEPRYRQLVMDCVEREEHDFGVVLIARGHEVGGGEDRRMVGTVARMVQVAETDDGRFAVVSVGTHRIRISAWLPDDPYPLADVEDWPDDDPDDARVAELVAELTPRVRRAAALALELGDGVADPQQEVSDDPLVASYHLCALAPLSVVDRYDLLSAAGPYERLTSLRDRMSDVEALLALRLGTD